jgi:hypothetical protein
MGMLTCRVKEAETKAVADPRSNRGKKWPIEVLLNSIRR